MRMRLVIVLSVLVAALAVPAVADAATKTVTMGGQPSQVRVLQRQLSSDANQFFRANVTIHRGDSVRFVPFGFHTVEFTPRERSIDPLITPGDDATGQLDAGGAPFWFNGQPRLNFNPDLLRSNFGKRLVYTGARDVQSGLPIQNRPRPMTVRFPKRGSFDYYCTVHPGMKGKVRVKGRGARIPSKRADRRAVARKIAGAVKAARRLRNADAPGNTVLLGNANRRGVEYFGMLPETLRVGVGTTVTFRMSRPSFEAHTGTFGPGDAAEEPNSYLGQLAASFQSPELDPRATYPSEPPGTTASYTSALHGNGFWNSGLLDAEGDTPPGFRNQVTFSQAGTFPFFCLVHPFMKGTVIVQ